MKKSGGKTKPAWDSPAIARAMAEQWTGDARRANDE